jgi:hypothetical protein
MLFEPDAVNGCCYGRDNQPDEIILNIADKYFGNLFLVIKDYLQKLLSH